MKKLTAYLLDDEPLALKRLIRLLRDTERVEVAGSNTDPVAALRELEAKPVEVLFIDIEMPDLNGFEMLGRLHPQPLVVFTTAYSQYALRAFEVHSVDYLLKPIDEAHLARALNKLERIYAGGEPRPDLDALLKQLVAAVPQTQPYPARMASRIGDRIEFVNVARVTHFYANEKLTYAATPQKDFVVDATINELEQTLDPAKFVRIHRSTIVNIDYIKELYSWFSDRMMVCVNDGKNSELTVARDRVKGLKEKLGL